jgi:hypothetical protein
MNIDQAKGKDAGGPITKRRFVKLVPADTTGNTVVQCNTLGEDAYGVALFSVASAEIARGKGVSVVTDGRVIVESAGSVNVGDAVATDAQGRGITAVAGNFVMGTCDENGGGVAGTEIGVILSLAGNKA